MSQTPFAHVKKRVSISGSRVRDRDRLRGARRPDVL
jgi:hypothetical protein